MWLWAHRKVPLESTSTKRLKKTCRYKIFLWLTPIRQLTILSTVPKCELNLSCIAAFSSRSNQIKSLLLSHHHSTSALVSEILMSVLQTVQKNNRQFTYGQTVQKKQQTIYIWTDSAKKNNRQFTYGQTVQKKLHWSIYSAPDSAKKHNNSNLHMDRQCKKTTAIYIWTVHIYRLYRRQCAKYTYIYSVHIVYYKDILNYQRHIIHRMGTSALCTVSIHNVVYA